MYPSSLITYAHEGYPAKCILMTSPLPPKSRVSGRDPQIRHQVRIIETESMKTNRSLYLANHLTLTGGHLYVSHPTYTSFILPAWYLTEDLQDISAKSPVLYTDNIQSRTSLDSRYSRFNERPSTRGQPTGGSQTMEEEAFEEVGLADEDVKPKKRGLFSSFGDSSSDNTNNNSRTSSSHLGFRLPGRKRGQSGQGAELSNYRPEVSTTEA